MIAKVFSAAFFGIEAVEVVVEAEVRRGLGSFDLVGLAQGPVRESKKRVQSALRQAGVSWQSKSITINLSPAALKKDGGALDFPIAVALMQALGMMAMPDQKQLLVGELALDGELLPVPGALAFADLAQQRSFAQVVVPWSSSAQAALVSGIEVLAPQSLADYLAYVRGADVSLKPMVQKVAPGEWLSTDWSDVKGQLPAKRVLEIAAAGYHNVLLMGPPGVGKTYLVQRFAQILPPVAENQLRQIQKMYALVSGHGQQNMPQGVPFRAPHHHATLAGMVGGGRVFRPGEFSLADQGVLFLDEMTEFRRDVIEALREPLENGIATVVRAEGVFHLPARFLLIGACNGCPCGALGDSRRTCDCSLPAIARYRRKLSGPILDRIDLVIQLPRPKWSELWAGERGEASTDVRLRVIAARHLQDDRYQQPNRCNGTVSSPILHQHMQLSQGGHNLLKTAMEQGALSARRMDKILRVSRTIADLDAASAIESHHLAEALQYRQTLEAE